MTNIEVLGLELVLALRQRKALQVELARQEAKISRLESAVLSEDTAAVYGGAQAVDPDNEVTRDDLPVVGDGRTWKALVPVAQWTQEGAGAVVSEPN